MHYLNWSILNFLEHEGVSMPHSGVCVYFHVSLKLELFSTNQFPGFIPLNNVWTYAEVPFLPQGERELQQGSLPPPPMKQCCFVYYSLKLPSAV